MNWISVQGLQISIVTRAMDALSRYVTRSSAPPLIALETKDLEQSLGKWKVSAETAAKADPSADGLAAHERYYTAVVRDTAHAKSKRNQLLGRGLNEKTYRAMILAWAGGRTGRPWSTS